MKINANYHSYSEPTKTKTEEKKNVQGTPQKIQESVELNLSSAAKNILASKQTDLTENERIQAIKTAIQKGNYQVSPEKIADAIVNTMTEQSELN